MTHGIPFQTLKQRIPSHKGLIILTLLHNVSTYRLALNCCFLSLPLCHSVLQCLPAGHNVLNCKATHELQRHGCIINRNCWRSTQKVAVGSNDFGATAGKQQWQIFEGKPQSLTNRVLHGTHCHSWHNKPSPYGQGRLPCPSFFALGHDVFLSCPWLPFVQSLSVLVSYSLGVPLWGDHIQTTRGRWDVGEASTYTVLPT